MAMHYFVSNITTISNESTINIKEEIEKAELDKIFKMCAFTGQMRVIKDAYDIAVRNGRELLEYLAKDNLLAVYEKSDDPKTLLTEANRLVYNFCASVETYIEYAKITSKKKGSTIYEEFSKFLSRIFDENFEYRFFYKLRNFLIHYAFPYTQIEICLPDFVELICQKEHLKKYSGWGAIVSKDLNNLDDNINISQYIERELVLITTIYIQVYYYYDNDYVKANTAIAELCEQYKLESPVIIQVEGDLSSGEKEIRQFPIDEIMRGIEILKKHPSVKLNIKNHNENRM